MTFGRSYAGTIHTFPNATVDLDTNTIVVLNIQSSLINCSRRHVAVDFGIKKCAISRKQRFLSSLGKPEIHLFLFW